jgi:hypothetical protein
MASIHDTTPPPSANPPPARVEAAQPGAAHCSTRSNSPAAVRAGCHGPRSRSPASSACIRLYNLASPDTRGRASALCNTTSMSPGTANFVPSPATLDAHPSMPSPARPYPSTRTSSSTSTHWLLRRQWAVWFKSDLSAIFFLSVFHLQALVLVHVTVVLARYRSSSLLDWWAPQNAGSSPCHCCHAMGERFVTVTPTYRLACLWRQCFCSRLV